MHMTARKLKSLSKPNIDRLEIVSMEGRYFLARFHCEQQVYLLTDDKDEPILFSGACAARDYFRKMRPTVTEVIPPTGTDEMIGMPEEDDSETMRVPL